MSFRDPNSFCAMIERKFKKEKWAAEAMGMGRGEEFGL
jgi:hypothetical protein